MNIQGAGLDLIRNPDKLYDWMGLKQSPGKVETTQTTKAPFAQKPKKEKDLFLEGFYSVADKPKEERRSYTSPFAKSRAILDSISQTKPAKSVAVDEEDDFLKGFYSVADRPKEETPISAQPPTVQKNTQTTYKPINWIRSTMTQPNPWNAKNTDLSPQKVNYASQTNTSATPYQNTYTGETRDEYDSRVRNQYAARRQVANNEKDILPKQAKAPTVYLHAKPKAPTVYFHATPEPLQPGTEDDFKSFSHISEGGIVNAANQKADEIINNAFRQKRNWFYNSYTDGTSPYDVSELKNAEYKIKTAEGASQLENAAINIIAELPGFGLGQLIKGSSILAKTPMEILKDILNGVPGDIFKNAIFEKVLKIPTLGKFVKDSITPVTLHSIDNAEKYYSLINDDRKKYLINSNQHRKIFLSRLQEELDKINNTETFGFLPPEENEKFKEIMSKRIREIISLNQNYEYEKQIADQEWERLKNSWAKDFPKSVTDY
ncbi:MAG: hypothetical protein IJE70_07485 [Oscillospiraceae bacterium]|nr:hypothetical protein [Oscillospiraceae bacterium]